MFEEENVINEQPIEETVISQEVAESVENAEEVEVSADEAKMEEAKNFAKWYVLHTFSGYENVAKENLEIVIGKYNLQLRIFDIVIPMEDVVEEKNGKKKVVSRKVMPGYIMVKMIYGDDIWHRIVGTRGITGFVGPKGRPLELREEEIIAMRLEVPNTDVPLEPKVILVSESVIVTQGISSTISDVSSVGSSTTMPSLFKIESLPEIGAKKRKTI